jgi:hypothetical protein
LLFAVTAALRRLTLLMAMLRIMWSVMAIFSCGRG